MSLDEENACDHCGRPLHPNLGAICGKCVHEFEFSEWLRGWVA